MEPKPSQPHPPSKPLRGFEPVTTDAVIFDTDFPYDLNNYTVTQCLGEGALGRVFLGTEKASKKKMAIKAYNAFVLKKKRQMTKTKEGKTIFVDKLEEVM